MRSVFSDAYRFMSPPACSKPAQNSTMNTNNMKMTRRRSTSSGVSGSFVPPDCASERLRGRHLADVARGSDWTSASWMITERSMPMPAAM